MVLKCIFYLDRSDKSMSEKSLGMGKNICLHTHKPDGYGDVSTFEVVPWVCNYIPQQTINVITCPCPNAGLCFCSLNKPRTPITVFRLIDPLHMPSAICTPLVIWHIIVTRNVPKGEFQWVDSLCASLTCMLVITSHKEKQLRGATISPFLLIWFNFNRRMDMQSHPL